MNLRHINVFYTEIAKKNGINQIKNRITGIKSDFMKIT